MEVSAMRFWIFYYALFGSRATRRALGFVVLTLTFFFYCFVHEAFDSPRRRNFAPVPYNPQPIKLGLPPSNWKPANR
jgi:hypothetical protein